MNKILFGVLLAVIGPCLCINSWQLPKRYLQASLISPDLHEHWATYKKTFNKTYIANNEELKRRIYWEDNYRFIQEHNEKYKRGESTFYVGENDKSDMAEDEMEYVFMHGLNETETVPESSSSGGSQIPVFTGEGLGEPPSTVNWLEYGMVTRVKNQGKCGSCWAMAAAAALEASYKKKTGYLVEVSEQNLVDCSAYSTGKGCDGGWPNEAFYYVAANGGIDSETCYPYIGYQYYCRYNVYCRAATATGYVNVAQNEAALMKAVGLVGPVAICLDTQYRSFTHYKGGVFYEPESKPTTPTNHCMLIVGYGESEEGNYWTVKNSWGTDWGVEGFVFMAKDRNNNCRIADHASYPY